jgi:A/G-specific adenine glycosylase
VAYILTKGGATAVVQRPPKGLLGGMLGLPTSDWRSEPWSEAEALSAAPLDADWRSAGEVEHVFTHFSLTLRLMRAETGQEAPGLTWTPRAGLEALPSVFMKAARAALANLL